jgi:DNA-binding transcriptional ArsR family regulator
MRNQMVTTTGRKKREAVFRAIADPTRRKVLGLLRERELTVGAIAEHFRMSRPAVSKHLRMLRAAGLIATRKSGAARICGLNAAPLRDVHDWLREYEVFWNAQLRNLKRYVEEER